MAISSHLSCVGVLVDMTSFVAVSQDSHYHRKAVDRHCTQLVEIFFRTCFLRNAPRRGISFIRIISLFSVCTSSHPTLLCRCKTNKHKYTCPKCEAPYCSLGCYKEHNNRCTEYFNQENVMEYLQSSKATDEGKLQMAEILSRAKEAEQREAEEFSILNKLEELDLGMQIKDSLFNFSDDPDLFFKLTKEEQQTFLAMLEKGNIAKLVPVWQPWWLNKEQDVIKSTVRVAMLLQLTSIENSSARNTDSFKCR